MLRAFIHDVLERYPELIPGVFPKLYQSWEVTSRDQEDEPTYIEMKLGFQKLLEKSEKFLNLCIFVDGVDEFDADHTDLSEFMCSLATRYVKVVVSSRPIATASSVFENHRCPTLKMQDLTADDIESYVRDKLCAHPRFVEMEIYFPKESRDLATELQEKPAGVFLWVHLVVRLLIEGIESGDDIGDLQRRLQSLPDDLRNLYRRMMSKMEPQYQSQAAEIFQLMYTWRQYISNQPFRTILLWFALERPIDVFDRPSGPLDMRIYQWSCKKTEARIMSRCCGLLEVRSKGEQLPIRNFPPLTLAQSMDPS